MTTLRPVIARRVLGASIEDCLFLRVTVLGTQRMLVDVLNAVHIKLAVMLQPNRLLLAANSAVIFVCRSNRYIIVGTVRHLADAPSSARRVNTLAMHGSTGFFTTISSSQRLLQTLLHSSTWTRADTDTIAVAPRILKLLTLFEIIQLVVVDQDIGS